MTSVNLAAHDSWLLDLDISREKNISCRVMKCKGNCPDALTDLWLMLGGGGPGRSIYQNITADLKAAG